MVHVELFSRRCVRYISVGLFSKRYITYSSDGGWSVKNTLGIIQLCLFSIRHPWNGLMDCTVIHACIVPALFKKSLFILQVCTLLLYDCSSYVSSAPYDYSWDVTSVPYVYSSNMYFSTIYIYVQIIVFSRWFVVYSSGLLGHYNKHCVYGLV